MLEDYSIHAFIQKYGIKTENGKTLDFKTHRYLFDIYRDNSKHLVCIKAGQIGFSTMAIIKTIWFAKNKKFNIGYILPTVEMVQKFVGSKVNPIAQQNLVIQQMMKDKDSITQKQIGGNFIHYLGSQTDLAAIMLSLDMLVGDEYDKSPMGTMETYDSRLQHSEHGYKWIFSNPTIPDFGVDRQYQDLMCDQKRWHITHSCGVQFPFEENCIDFKAEVYRCPSCQGEILDEERRMGDWYNKDGVKWSGELEPGYEWSGWWIPLWINPMFSASRIAQYKRNKTPEYFANFVAGTAYVNPNDALSQRTLEKNLVKEVNEQNGRTIIGLDTGHNLHYVLMNKQGVYYHGYCDSPQERNDPTYDPYTEIDLLLAKNKSWILVADQGGDLIGVRKLQIKYPGRVFLCWFVKETRNKELIRWGEDEEFGKVLVDRNRVVQLAVDQLNETRIPFNYDDKQVSALDWQPFFAHALNIYRVKEIIGDQNDPQYGWRWVWKRKGPDHWFMALIYALVGMDKYAEDLATFVGKDQFMAGVPMGTDINGVITGRRLGVRADF